MSNHGLLSLFKLIPCHKHWIVFVLAYLNFIFEFWSSFSTAQNCPLCLDTKYKTDLNCLEHSVCISLFGVRNPIWKVFMPNNACLSRRSPGRVRCPKSFNIYPALSYPYYSSQQAVICFCSLLWLYLQKTQLPFYDLSVKKPQWKKTAVEKVYEDKDYSI